MIVKTSFISWCFHHHSNQMLRFDFQADFDWKCDSIIIPLGLGQQDKSDWTPSTGDLWLAVVFWTLSWMLVDFKNVSYCTLTLCEVSHVSLSWTLYLSSMLTSTIQAHNSSLKWCDCKIWSYCCYLLLLNVDNVLVYVLVVYYMYLFKWDKPLEWHQLVFKRVDAFMTNVGILLTACLVFSAAYIDSSGILVI